MTHLIPHSARSRPKPPKCLFVAQPYQLRGRKLLHKSRHQHRAANDDVGLNHLQGIRAGYRSTATKTSQQDMCLTSRVCEFFVGKSRRLDSVLPLSGKLLVIFRNSIHFRLRSECSSGLGYVWVLRLVRLPYPPASAAPPKVSSCNSACPLRLQSRLHHPDLCCSKSRQLQSPTATMMHPSRRAYVEEAESEVSQPR